MTTLTPPMTKTTATLITVTTPPAVPPATYPAPIMLAVRMRAGNVMDVTGTPDGTMEEGLLAPPRIVPACVAGTTSFLDTCSGVSVSLSVPCYVAAGRVSGAVCTVRRCGLALAGQTVRYVWTSQGTNGARGTGTDKPEVAGVPIGVVYEGGAG